MLEIAGPDMPFLVDSVMGELADQGIATLGACSTRWRRPRGRAGTR